MSRYLSGAVQWAAYVVINGRTLTSKSRFTTAADAHRYADGQEFAALMAKVGAPPPSTATAWSRSQHDHQLQHP